MLPTGNEPGIEAGPGAVILLSGGLDSATALAIARDMGYDTYAMSFRYGQRHERELDAAIAVARSMEVRDHIVVDIDLRQFGGSALTADMEVPKGRDSGEMSAGIPVTYVPARNTIFLAYALGWAETLGVHDIFLGVNAVDYSGYPDCRPEFIGAFEKLANLATRDGVEGRSFSIHAPLISMTKAEIIRTGHGLGVDYSLTHSCYDPSPDGVACGECDSCIHRKRGFIEAGVADPTRYHT